MTEPNSIDRKWLIWAGIGLLACLDALTGTPKYFSAGSYLCISLAAFLKGFNLFGARKWGPLAFNLLTTGAIVLMIVSIGKRILV